MEPSTRTQVQKYTFSGVFAGVCSRWRTTGHRPQKKHATGREQVNRYKQFKNINGYEEE